MKKQIIILLSVIISTFASAQSKQNFVKEGEWSATLSTLGGELPFGLDIKPKGNGYEVLVLNGTEHLPMDFATIQDDSLHIPMDMFDSELVAKVSEKIMIGFWKKRRTGQSYLLIPFKANWGKKESRFMPLLPANGQVGGKWSADFMATSGKDTTHTVGLFTQKGNVVQGSFLTTTGDYRYLAGNVSGDSLLLSCYDGSHVFLFKAKIAGDKMTGLFWSGVNQPKTWIATRNDQASLPDLTKLTYLKQGYDRVDFRFPNLEGKQVSLQDERYKGKVVVVQIMGSWCPNCMDESNFAAPWYKKNHKRGVEIIGLAFEKSTDLAVSAPRLQRLKQRFGIDYEILLAGTNNSSAASEALPMLNKVLGFPTTIFIDKKGKVREIHTGFTGPGTGAYYDEFVHHFNQLIDKLVVE
jgi:thiol-disulfide isomerase/thioredoxin